jgi:hypothetical protein
MDLSKRGVSELSAKSGSRRKIRKKKRGSEDWKERETEETEKKKENRGWASDVDPITAPVRRSDLLFGDATPP